MGDSLSSAVLRLFKFNREYARNLDNVNHPHTCNKTVQIQDTKVLVLDISFRDDLRLFCAWSRLSSLPAAAVHEWATEQLETRYVTGTVKLEDSDNKIFIGLSTVWVENSLVLSPAFADSYNDCRTLKPWNSWAPSHQPRAVISGLVCRAYCQRKSAFINAFATLLKARYPLNELVQHARKWAKFWKPPHSEFSLPSNVDDIEYTIAIYASDAEKIWRALLFSAAAV